MQNVQGNIYSWINRYRKPFLWVHGILFVALWFFTRPLWPFPNLILAELAEGLGGLLLIAGVIGRMYSSLTIASYKNTRVVKTEMYSVVRHPLYFFSFMMAIGVGLLTGRVELLVYICIFFFACFYPIIRHEEKNLESKFGQEYAEYRKQVPMLIPNFWKWTAREKMEINMRLVTRTILDGSLPLLFFPVLEIIEAIHG